MVLLILDFASTPTLRLCVLKFSKWLVLKKILLSLGCDYILVLECLLCLCELLSVLFMFQPTLRILPVIMPRTWITEIGLTAMTQIRLFL